MGAITRHHPRYPAGDRLRPRQLAAHDQDPVHRAATYPEIINLTQMQVSPHWHPFAMSLSTADRSRFHTEFQQRLTAESRPIANTDLQLLAHVRGAPAIEWHQPTPEIII